MQFGGSTKWSVLVGTTGVINTVTSCAGVSTTTTTTTLPAITVTATPSCDGSGFNGQGRVTANFSGGTSSYTWTAIGTSEAAAIACVNNPSCSQRFTVGGSSSFAFTSLANGPYYVAVLDSNGGLGYSGLATVSCNSTTTSTTTTTTAPLTTSTTTTTTTPSLLYDYYTANVFPCNDCGGSTETILVAFDAGSPVTLNRFYIAQSGPDGFSYQVVDVASSGVAYLLSSSFGSFTSCVSACNV
jgi:hypothetical protein